MIVRPSASLPLTLGRTLVIGGLAASLLSSMIAGALIPQPPRAIDPCALSFDAATLVSRDRGLVARHALACSDVTHGRITQAAYRAQVAAIDAAWTTPAAAPVPPAIQWASTVRGYSSQYTATSWAADRVLGAPDVFPQYGDHTNAWASLGADDRDEWIEVGYAQPIRASAVEVFETFNPGAVTAIELITASGQRITAFQGAPAGKGQAANKLHAEVGCTAEPIIAVHVRLASPQVAGWNELDAIGLQPCAD